MQVFEHDTLVIGQQGFATRHFDALVRYNDRHGCTFFKVGHQRLHFSSFVGVIQVGDLAIEILPKAERGAVVDKGKWQRALLNMLRQAGFLSIEAAPEADLHLRRSPLIDLYIEAFLGEVTQLVYAGLVKKYRTTEANLNKLKGRILFRQQISRNLLHRERMYTAHPIYDRDNVFNRILKCALGIVERLAIQSALVARAKSLSLAFESASESRITSETFERLNIDRSTDRYRKAIQMARLIILNYSPDLRGGHEHVVAILFDMNKLFERFILVQLSRAQAAFADRKLRVNGQTSKRFWAAKNIRPDIVAEFDQDNTRQRVILDTKWKIPSNGLPTDDDLRQMYAYNLHFGGHRSILVYPRSDNEQKGISRSYEKSITLPDDYSHTCSMYYIDLFDDKQQLRSDIGTMLIKKEILNPSDEP
ncbi:MAG: restriction endonuclease [Pseudomonadota bacterium]